MKTFDVSGVWRRLTVLSALLALAASAQPLKIHPGNPHYFEFHGRGIVLIGSGEHYGAVLNKAFDYRRYLDTIARDRLNQTRAFSGVYREDPSSFDIANNTLAPDPANFLAPWKRVAGGPPSLDKLPRFDLETWNPEYFDRLKNYVAEASRRGVVVEISLFCPFYGETQWRLSPFHPDNNVNATGTANREDVYTLQNPALTRFQERLVEKIVQELNSFENIYFEICNEPYFGGVRLDWQRRIAQVIRETESHLPQRHLIAQNIANGSTVINDPDDAVSIFNFHYCRPPRFPTVEHRLETPHRF